MFQSSEISPKLFTNVSIFYREFEFKVFSFSLIEKKTFENITNNKDRLEMYASLIQTFAKIFLYSSHQCSKSLMTSAIYELVGVKIYYDPTKAFFALRLPG